ncbi:hypothetical protein LTR78_009338 [Recurvomyces mirabilis]|uniref:PNPLA domain-containing protein n=1 Tax=Recurvomyces mirabilis TaxID=574656 RepID=A0AAE0TRS2_9PEZI|nr:hypothetical protein LTR78_009338 [Recurvomyces mirabilis]
MFDYPETGMSGVKLAVTTTTTGRASTRIITNYNGAAYVGANHGYDAIRPQESALEPLLWQAGRATSAAPGLFAPYELNGIGTFQDGALRHNNPINIALWESNRIWPRTSTDAVLSLGTGTAAATPSPHTIPGRRTLEEKFIPRLCRSFLTSLDGELTWRSLLCSLGKEALDRFFRLNIEFRGYEPRLDDVSAIDELSRSVNAAKDDKQLNAVKLALLATSFFFELRRAPKFDSSGFYICQGEICVRGDYVRILMGLRSIDKTGTIGFWNDQQSLGRLDLDTDKCSVCNRFCKQVCFFVRHPMEKVSIALALGERRRQISGFPQTVSWFSSEQHLDTPFYHKETADPLAWKCECRRHEDQVPSSSIKRRSSAMSLANITSKRMKHTDSLDGISA